jgi:hypothetical protein
VLGCTLASLDGDTSREIDIPEGGIVLIEGSVLEKGPASENPELIEYLAEEYDPKRNHSFTMRDSVLINDETAHAGVFIHFFRPASQGLSVSGSTFVGQASDAAVRRAEGNSVFPSRLAAHLPPFPALPPTGSGASAACTGMLQLLCGDKSRGCKACVSNHHQPLRLAGCSNAAVDTFCRSPPSSSPTAKHGHHHPLVSIDKPEGTAQKTDDDDVQAASVSNAPMVYYVDPAGDDSSVRPAPPPLPGPQEKSGRPV